MNSDRRPTRIEHTPEDHARIESVRERFQRERPSLDELVANGEFGPPINQGDYWDMVEMLVALRAEREKAGIDRPTAAARLGMDSEALGRLESGADDPTIELLRRYAAALGKQIVLTLTDLTQPRSAENISS